MKVIFFDGYCGLCNGFINFMMKIDHKAQFKFSPLQSEFAKSRLPPEDIINLKSLVVLINNKYERKALGVLSALSELGGVWKMALILKILPLSILNCAYDIIASNRYRLFGKRETCRLPSSEEKARFIL